MENELVKEYLHSNMLKLEPSDLEQLIKGYYGNINISQDFEKPEFIKNYERKITIAK